MWTMEASRPWRGRVLTLAIDARITGFEHLPLLLSDASELVAADASFRGIGGFGCNDLDLVANGHTPQSASHGGLDNLLGEPTYRTR